MSKETQKSLGQPELPEFDSIISVESGAAEIEAALERLIETLEKRHQCESHAQKAKEIAKKMLSCHIPIRTGVSDCYKVWGSGTCSIHFSRCLRSVVDTGSQSIWNSLRWFTGINNWSYPTAPHFTDIIR